MNCEDTISGVLYSVARHARYINNATGGAREENNQINEDAIFGEAHSISGNAEANPRVDGAVYFQNIPSTSNVIDSRERVNVANADVPTRTRCSLPAPSNE